MVGEGSSLQAEEVVLGGIRFWHVRLANRTRPPGPLACQLSGMSLGQHQTKYLFRGVPTCRTEDPDPFFSELVEACRLDNPASRLDNDIIALFKGGNYPSMARAPGLA